MKTEQFYNRFSFFYPLADLFLEPQKRHLFREIDTHPPGELLEIGVGNGSHLPHYRTHTVTAIDTSPKMLAIAAKHQAPNIRLLYMDGGALLFPDRSFDYVVLCHVIAVADDPGAMLEEAYRVLKPGGKIFILNHFTPANWLRYVDRAFQLVSKQFHFRSLFYIESLPALNRFTLLKETTLGRSAYFKLLIYGKR